MYKRAKSIKINEIRALWYKKGAFQGNNYAYKVYANVRVELCLWIASQQQALKKVEKRERGKWIMTSLNLTKRNIFLKNVINQFDVIFHLFDQIFHSIFYRFSILISSIHFQIYFIFIFIFINDMNNDRLFKLAIFFMMIIVCHFLRLDQGDHLALGQQDHLKTKNQEMDAFRKA